MVSDPDSFESLEEFILTTKKVITPTVIKQIPVATNEPTTKVLSHFAGLYFLRKGSNPAFIIFEWRLLYSRGCSTGDVVFAPLVGLLRNCIDDDDLLLTDGFNLRKLESCALEEE